MPTRSGRRCLCRDVCSPLQGKRIYTLLFTTFKVLPGFGNTGGTRISHELSPSKNPHSAPPVSTRKPCRSNKRVARYLKLTQELQSSWRTIKQLESFDPFELPENARFLCKVSLVKIDCTKGWCYQGFFNCRRSISGDGSEVWCNRCDSVNKKRKGPVWWYKLDALVEDATGTMNLMIFAGEAQGLIGVAAEDLVDEITDENRRTMPDAIKNLIGSTHAFQVAIDHRSLGFVVKWVLDDDALMLLQHIGSSQVTVGGGDSPLPEEEGPSSASSCSSQLTEVGHA